MTSLFPNPWWCSVLIYCFPLITRLLAHWLPYFFLHMPSIPPPSYDLVLCVPFAWNTLPPDVYMASSLPPLIFIQMSSSQWGLSWPLYLQLQQPSPLGTPDPTYFALLFPPTAFSTSNILLIAYLLCALLIVSSYRISWGWDLILYTNAENRV